MPRPVCCSETVVSITCFRASSIEPLAGNIFATAANTPSKKGLQPTFNPAFRFGSPTSSGKRRRNKKMQGGGLQECTRAKHSEGRERPHFGRLSAAQTSVGSLPACHHRTVTVFCPRAYRNVFDPKSREEEYPIAERRRSQCQS